MKLGDNPCSYPFTGRSAAMRTRSERGSRADRPPLSAGTSVACTVPAAERRKASATASTGMAGGGGSQREVLVHRIRFAD
jgi:hypothetical protein